MACTGAHCDNHGTGTTTCVEHRGECSTNRPFNPSGEFGVQGATIRASDVDLLRGLIRDELARYNLHALYEFPLRQEGGYGSSTTIDNSHINDLEQMTFDGNGAEGGVQGQPALASYADGAIVDDGNWISLRDKYNLLRQDCICNSDCACNNVCACHNDCGCNYSDERLKTNIKYLQTRNNLNIYSFEYLWDNKTTHVGVMAQEILNTPYKHAVKQDSRGFYMVDYNKLPI